MSNDERPSDRGIDWDAIAVDSDGGPGTLERLRRVVDLFDRLNLPHSDAGVEPFRWGALEVFEPLGSGSFGTVYRAYDGHLKREVALKLMPADAPGATDWLEEARRLARVRHPNVVAILGAEVDGDFAGIWMELSDGRALDSALAETTTLPGTAVIELAQALASALAAIHEQGLVHGDLKASNVLIEPSGRVVLLDFGSAAEASGSDPARTGSPLSAAPEILAGQALTPAADLYALGVLLYRCLSGRYPFTGDDVKALEQAQQKRPDLSHLPRDYRSLLSALLARNAANRPDSDHVQTRLTAISTAPEQRLKRLALGGVFASLILGVLIAAFGWWQTGAARDAEQRAAEQARASLQFFQDVVGATFQGTHGQDARLIDVLEQAERQLTLDQNQPLYVRAMVHYVVGSSYLDLGRSDEGLALLDESLALLADDEDASPEAVASVLTQQGLEWCEQDAARAEAAADDIRRVSDGRLPPDHRVFAAALKIEACSAQLRGDDALAEQRLREAMALRPPEQYPADISAIGTVQRLGAVLLDQRRVGEALPLLEQARSQFLALLGTRHDTTLGTASALAAALLESSRFAEAVDLLEETLPEVEARNGRESQQWIATASTLATALARAGEPARALALNDQVIDSSKRELGPSHRFTLTAMANRGIRLKELGRLDDAEAAMAQAADAVEQAFDGAHPLALINQVNRVEVLVMLERGEDAVRLGRPVLSTSMEALGVEHGITAGAQAYLARALGTTGDFEEAERFFSAALDFQVRNNPNSIQTFETRFYYTEMLIAHDRVAEARQQLIALQPARQRLPSDHSLLRKIEALEKQLIR